MDSDLLLLLLRHDVADAVVDRPCGPEYRVSVLQEILQSGGGGVTPRKRHASEQWSLSALTPLMSFLWRARLIEETTFSISGRASS